MFEAAEIGHRIHAYVTQRAEKRREEHDLGEDEPAHAPAKRGAHLLIVEARLGLVRDGIEPAREHIEQHDKTEQQHDLAHSRSIHHPCRAKAQHADGDGSRERPLG